MVGVVAAVTDKKKKPEFEHPWQGLGALIEGGMSAIKWLFIFIGLSILLGLAAIGFAVAWWLK